MRQLCPLGESHCQGKTPSSYRDVIQRNYTKSLLGMKLNLIYITCNSSKIYVNPSQTYFPKPPATNARGNKKWTACIYSICICILLCIHKQSRLNLFLSSQLYCNLNTAASCRIPVHCKHCSTS